MDSAPRAASRRRVNVGSVASPDLATFAIEDDGGRFEIEAGAAEFPEVLTRRLRSLPHAGE